MEQAVSRKKKVKIIIAPTYDDAELRSLCGTNPRFLAYVGFQPMSISRGFLSSQFQF